MCNNKTQLLVVDDDTEIRDLLAHYLAKENFRVITAKSGETVARILSEQRIHLVILDLMMPGEDGLSICRRIRVNSTIPIIILTAKGEEIDRIIGLEMGADDYMAKPFNPRELVARIKAVLWRTTHIYKDPGQDTQDETLAFDEWKINLSERKVLSPDGSNIELSSGEFDLLLAFVSNPKRILTRDQLLDLTKGRTLDPYDRSIDVQVSRLRRKIETDPQKPTIIKTVRGVGYTFTPAVNRT
ncbi:MAG: response regulator [Gammaproteobacteria bacterium]|nr:response regulator [Gammaproteobacteria bacterium]